MWQVVPEEETRLSAKRAALDAERYRLDQVIREAVDRKRYCSDPDEVARAAADERTYLVQMDQLPTCVVRCRSSTRASLVISDERSYVRAANAGVANWLSTN
jgi:hypothetical protein